MGRDAGPRSQDWSGLARVFARLALRRLHCHFCGSHLTGSYQVAGLVLLLGFGVALSWIYLKGLFRERVWIDDESIRICRMGILSDRQETACLAEVRGV
jgi:hypothetical protein